MFANFCIGDMFLTLRLSSCFFKFRVVRKKGFKTVKNGLVISTVFPIVLINVNQDYPVCSLFYLCIFNPLGPSSSFVKRHRSDCNPASNGVSTKLILFNPQGVNPQACGKRAAEEDAGPGWQLTYGCSERANPLPSPPHLQPSLRSKAS